MLDTTRTQRHLSIDIGVYHWLARQAQHRKPVSLGRVIDDLVAAQRERTGDKPFKPDVTTPLIPTSAEWNKHAQ
jgi:hypothetical protein